MIKNKHLCLLAVTAAVYVFLIGPLLVIAASSFSDTPYLKFPGEGFTLRWYAQILKVRTFGPAALSSVFIAFLATGAALVLGLPAAYALNRYWFRGKEFIRELFLSPVLIPVIVLGFVMLRFVVNRYRLPLLPALLVGHILLSLPYVMRVVTASLTHFDFSVEEAARSLGAGGLYTFFHILLPGIRSGIAAACVMAAINSFNNVSLSAFLTGAGISMLPIEMMAYVEYHFDPTIAALATLLMGATLLVMLAVEKTLGLGSVV